MSAAVATEEEALAAYALIRAYVARDRYTAARILGRWASGEDGMGFAAVVASSAAIILTREAAGDRDGALRAADAALEVSQGLAVQAHQVLATSLFGDPAAGLREGASARLRAHSALLRPLNLAPVLVLAAIWICPLAAMRDCLETGKQMTEVTACGDTPLLIGRYLRCYRPGESGSRAAPNPCYGVAVDWVIRWAPSSGNQEGIRSGGDFRTVRHSGVGKTASAIRIGAPSGGSVS